MNIVAIRLLKFGAETLKNESFNAIILSFYKSIYFFTYHIMNKSDNSSLKFRSFLTIQSNWGKQFPKYILTNIASDKKTNSRSKPIASLYNLITNT